MTTDLALITENDLVIRDPDTGAPIAVRMPGGGEVSFDDLAGLALWKRTIMDLKFEALRPVEHMVDEAIFQHLDRAGSYTVHLENGLEVSGESAAAWQDSTTVDADALRADLLLLRIRAGDKPADAEAWVDALIKTERTVTAKGKATLDRMAGEYREALAAHTTPLERSRKAPSVRRAK